MYERNTIDSVLCDIEYLLYMAKAHSENARFQDLSIILSDAKMELDELKKSNERFQSDKYLFNYRTTAAGKEVYILP